MKNNNIYQVANTAVDNVTVFPNIIKDSNKLMVPIRGSTFLSVVRDTVKLLVEMGAVDIASELGVPVKYAEILRREAIKKFSSWYHGLDLGSEIFNGAYFTEGSGFTVTGVVPSDGSGSKSKMAELANLLPIGRMSIHPVSPMAKIVPIDGYAAGIRRLFQTTANGGPIIFLRSIDYESYGMRRHIANVAEENSLRGVEKYIVRPCALGATVTKLESAKVNQSYHSIDHGKYPQAINAVESILDSRGTAYLSLSLGKDISGDDIVFLAKAIKDLDARYGFLEISTNYSEYIYEALLLAGLGHKVNQAPEALGTLVILCAHIECGFRVKNHGAKLWTVAKDTTVKDIAKAVGLPSSHILIPTNHAYNSGPSFTFHMGGEMVVSRQNPRYGIIFRMAPKNKKVSAGTKVVVCDIDIASVFGKKEPLVV